MAIKGGVCNDNTLGTCYMSHDNTWWKLQHYCVETATTLCGICNNARRNPQQYFVESVRRMTLRSGMEWVMVRGGGCAV